MALDVGHLSIYPSSITLTPFQSSPIRYWCFLCRRNHPRHFHLCSCVWGSPQSCHHDRGRLLQGVPCPKGRQIHHCPDHGCLCSVPGHLRSVPPPDQGNHSSLGGWRSRSDQLHASGHRRHLCVVCSYRFIAWKRLPQRVCLRKYPEHPTLPVVTYFFARLSSSVWSSGLALIPPTSTSPPLSSLWSSPSDMP